jgi:hypothetical protein
MLERLEAQARQRAEAAADLRRDQLAVRLEELAPPGLGIETAETGVVLTGRRLGRRLLTDPALRWLIVEARDER